MNTQFDNSQFIIHLAHTGWPEKSVLPDEANELSILSSSKWPNKLDEQIQKVAEIILANPSWNKEEWFLNCKSLLDEKFKKLRESITQFVAISNNNNDPSAFDETTQKTKKQKINGEFTLEKNEFNCETVLEVLNDLLVKNQDYGKQMRCYHFIFEAQHLKDILTRKKIKGKSFVEILKNAIAVGNYDAIRECLSFIQRSKNYQLLTHIPNLQNLFNIKETSDFIIIVDKSSNNIINNNKNMEIDNNQNHLEHIYVNRAILSEYSSYFSALFNNCWNGNEKKEMTISENISTIKPLLHYLYTFKFDFNMCDDLSFYKQADAWGLKELMKDMDAWYIKMYGMNFSQLESLFDENNNSMLKPTTHQDLSTENYARRFYLGETKKDKALLQEIFHFVIKKIFEIDSEKDKLQKFLNEKDELQKFLKEKGHWLETLDLKRESFTSLFHIPSIPNPKIYEYLKQLLEYFPNLSSLKLPRWPLLTFEEMKFIKQKNLKELYFCGAADFKGLMIFADFKELETLVLSGNNNKFSISSTTIPDYFGPGKSDEDYMKLAENSYANLFTKMTNLKMLEISNCGGVNLVLPGLKDKLNIQQLVLKNTDVSDASASILATLSSLQKLDISSCPSLSGQFFETITPALQKLKELDVRNSFNDRKFRYGRSLKYLKLDKLWIQSQFIMSNPQLAGIEKITTLNEFWTTACYPEFLAKLQNIQKLHIESRLLGGDIQDEHIKAISALSKLTELEIEDMPSVKKSELTEASWESFQAMKNLKSLSIRSSSTQLFRDEFFTALGKLDNLTSIKLAGNKKSLENITKACGAILAQKSNLKELTLDQKNPNDLPYFAKIGNSFVIPFKNHQGLEILNLNGTAVGWNPLNYTNDQGTNVINIEAKATPDSMITSLASISNLKELTLPSSYPPFFDLQPLLALKKLERLVIGGKKFTLNEFREYCESTKKNQKNVSKITG